MKLALASVIGFVSMSAAQTTLPLPGPNNQLANFLLFDSLRGGNAYGHGGGFGHGSSFDSILPYALLSSGNLPGSDLTNLLLLDSLSSRHRPSYRSSHGHRPVRGFPAFLPLASDSIEPTLQDSYANHPNFYPRSFHSGALPLAAQSAYSSTDQLQQDLTNFDNLDSWSTQQDFSSYPTNFNSYHAASNGAPFAYGMSSFNHRAWDVDATAATLANYHSTNLNNHYDVSKKINLNHFLDRKYGINDATVKPSIESLRQNNINYDPVITDTSQSDSSNDSNESA